MLRGQLGLAVITQPVLVEAHRTGTGLFVELPGADMTSVFLLDQERPRDPGQFINPPTPAAQCSVECQFIFRV
jgi:hypothetical protein